MGTNTKGIIIGLNSGITLGAEINDETASSQTVYSSQKVDELVGVVKNQRDGSTLKVWSGTQAQYDGIATKDPQTLYFIV